MARNPLDGMDGRSAMRLLLDSACTHGVSARKRCSKCQSAAADARWNPARRKQSSVYERRF